MELLGNPSYNVNIKGDMYNYQPCQSIANESIIMFDTAKRNTDTYPDINQFGFTPPQNRLQGVFSVALREFQYPLFASLSGDQYFNVHVENMGVGNEGNASSTTATNSAASLQNITLQAPLIPAYPGANWCIWRWDDGGQKPVRYYQRDAITGFQVSLRDKTGALITTSISAGTAGPTMRMVFGVVHKQ